MNEKHPIILILEDDPYLRRQLKGFFENEGFEVLDCVNIYEAKEKWNENKYCIDVMVVDSNMSPNGLTDAEIALTNGGCFTGWIWIKNYVLDDKEYPFPIERVILLSDYIPRLEEFLCSNKEYGYKELEIMKEKDHLIHKGGTEDATDKVIKAVKKIIASKLVDGIER